VIIGKIKGKTTPTEFSFDVMNDVQNLEYVQIPHDSYGYVLGQIVGLEKDDNGTTGVCQVIGYREEGRVKIPRIPFDPGTEVLYAEDEFVKETIKLHTKERGGFLGHLAGRDIEMYLDLNKVMTKHMSVLAKSGSGKSYTVGVLLEEIMEKGVPVLVLDPHGEYSTLSEPTQDPASIEKLAKMGMKPDSYPTRIWGDPDVVPGAEPLTIPHDFSTHETADILPKKPNGSQLAVLYNAFKNMSGTDLESLLHTVDLDDSNAKYQLTSMLERLDDLDVFTTQKTNFDKFVKPGVCNILNFKGLEPYVQELATYKIVKELFEKRKKKEVPPFFLVLEEAHNFCPERTFGEKKSSDILRTVASEGRKFGLGLCVISQRPARVDKNVLSQCSTQIIMKITNPNDLRAVSKSVENMTSAAEDEIQNLQVGSGLITGIHDMPLLTDVRPRKTKHGGEAQTIFITQDRPGDEDRQKELLHIIEPSLSFEDAQLLADDDVSVKIELHPVTLFTCGQEEITVVMSNTDGKIITDIDTVTKKRIPEPEIFTEPYVDVLKRVHEEEVISVTEPRDVIEELVERGYLEEHDEGIQFSSTYIFTDPREQGLKVTPKYKEVLYDKKYTSSATSPRQKLAPYADIRSEREAYILEYVYS